MYIWIKKRFTGPDILPGMQVNFDSIANIIMKQTVVLHDAAGPTVIESPSKSHVPGDVISHSRQKASTAE